MSDFDDILNDVIDDDKEEYLGQRDKINALAIEQGMKAAQTGQLLTNLLGSYAYARQIVETGGVTYIGLAEPGTALTSEAWMIVKIDASGNQYFAEGNRLFDKIFQSYDTYTYL